MSETVLIADDEGDVVDLLAMNFTLDGFRVLTAADGASALDLARNTRPSCVIVDVMMPVTDGFRVCRLLRGDPRTSDCAIVMLTAKTRAADKVEGFACGADDFVTKPFDPREVTARVSSILRRRRDMAEVSPLTGFPGNRAILRAIETRLALHPQDVAVIHADLDGFKGINDSLGFIRGDEALLATAEALAEAVVGVPGAFLGHLGGDDFVVVCDDEDAPVLWPRMIECFEVHMRGFDGGDRLALSMGVARSSQGPFTTAEEAAMVATEMKNRAKRQAGTAVSVDAGARELT